MGFFLPCFFRDLLINELHMRFNHPLNIAESVLIIHVHFIRQLSVLFEVIGNYSVY